MISQSAVDLLERFAAPVGFHKQPLPRVDQAPEIPASSVLWVASYAQILAIPAQGDEEAIRTTTRKGQEWLDLSCMAQERRSEYVVDGYLLLLLATAPDQSLTIVIRQLELDPTACRKHFAWPIENAVDTDLMWARIFRVTAIGMPKSPVSIGMTGSPILETPLQKKLLEDIKELKGRNAARQHAENPSSAPDA